MFKNSIVLSAVIRLIITLRSWFEASGYFKLFTKIADYFGSLYKNSFLYRFFDKKPYKTTSSVSLNVINWIFSLFYKLLHNFSIKIKNCAEKSLIIRFIQFMLKNWYCISIRNYSLTLLIFTTVRMVCKHISIGKGLDKFTILLGVLSIIGALLDVSIAGLYQGSILKKIIGLPDLNNKIRLSIDIKQHIATTVVIITGSLLGMATLLPMWYLAVGGIVGFILVISRPKAGAFLIVAFFPFLPTMGVVGISLLVMFAMFIQYISGDKSKIKMDGIDFCILVMCGILVYGIVNSYARMASIPAALVYIVFVSSFYIIRRSITDKTFLYSLIDTMITVAALVSLYGIYQKISGQADTTWQDTSMFENMGGRVYSTFSNPNVLGEYLLITIPLTIARLFYTDNSNRKFSYLCMFALQLICMVLTFSRGCWIGLLLSIALFFMFNGRKTTAFCILALCAIPFVMPDVIVQRLASVGNTSDSSTSYRVYIWEGTFRMLRDFWYSGIGIGTEAFNTVYPMYALNAIVAPHSHNLYLHILVETGIMGMLVVLTLLKMFFKHLTNAAKKIIEFRPLAFGIGTGMVGYLIQGMFDNVWYNYRIYFFFFIILAIGTAVYDLSKKEKTNG